MTKNITRKEYNPEVPKVGRNRLLKLADFLENKVVEPRAFDLNCWIHEDTCGTVACAVGWAAHARLFPELISDGIGQPVIRDSWNAKEKWYDVFGFYAAEQVFKITEEQAVYLFSSTYYKADSPRVGTVVKAIRKFVNDNGVADNKEWTRRYD